MAETFSLLLNYNIINLNKISIYLGNALSCRAFPLSKQSYGLFGNSPFAERLTLCRASPRTPPEALPLDSAKGTLSLWNPDISLHKFIICSHVSNC